MRNDHARVLSVVRRAGLCDRAAALPAGVGVRGRPGAAAGHLAAHRYDSSLPIGIYIAACGVVTLIATALLPEPNRARVAREFEQRAAEPVPEPALDRVAVPTR
jgi:hypothetical protein